MSWKRDLPASPVVKTLPSSAGGVGSIPGQGAKLTHTLRQKQTKEQKNTEVIL